jgi:MFS family permease
VTFRALRSRHYRLFFSGQLVSLLGTWIQITALNWVVYDLRGSSTDLGLVSLAAAVPLLPASLLGGAAADRIPKRKILILTQCILMSQAFALAVLLAGHWLRLWHVLLLAVLMGAGAAVDIPTRHAFVVEILERREDLSNAIALNSTLFNLARTVGPALAGILVASGGAALAFFVNGISYLFAVTALLLIRVPARAPSVHRSVGRELLDGLRYARRRVLVRELVGIIAVSAFFAMPFMILMPAFGREVLGTDARQYGFLLSSVGLGAVAGGLLVASLPEGTRLGRIFPVGFLGFPLLLILFASTRDLHAAMIVGGVSGLAFVLQNALANTLLQHGIEDAFRGRVMSLYALVFQAAFRTGAMAAGALAQHVGIATALALSSMVPLAYGLRLLLRGRSFWASLRDMGML